MSPQPTDSLFAHASCPRVGRLARVCGRVAPFYARFASFCARVAHNLCATRFVSCAREEPRSFLHKDYTGHAQDNGAGGDSREKEPQCRRASPRMGRDACGQNAKSHACSAVMSRRRLDLVGASELRDELKDWPEGQRHGHDIRHYHVLRWWRAGGWLPHEKSHSQGGQPE